MNGGVGIDFVEVYFPVDTLILSGQVDISNWMYYDAEFMLSSNVL